MKARQLSTWGHRNSKSLDNQNTISHLGHYACLPADIQLYNEEDCLKYASSLTVLQHIALSHARAAYFYCLALQGLQVKPSVY